MKKVVLRQKIFSSFRELLYNYVNHFTFKNIDRLSSYHISKNRPQLNILAFDFVSHCVNFQGIYELESLELLFSYMKHGQIVCRNGNYQNLLVA